MPELHQHFRAAYVGPDKVNRFLNKNQVYELQRIDAPADPSAPKIEGTAYMVSGIPGNFVYKTEEAFIDHWQVVDADMSDNVGQLVGESEA